MRTVLLISVLSLAACGGGGGESASQSSTTVNNCPGESIAVSLGDLPDVVDAAADAGVSVEDHSEDSAPSDVVDVPGLDQGSTLREGGVIIATCGGTVVANDSQDNDVVNGAQKVKRALASGDVYKLEIYRGE